MKCHLIDVQFVVCAGEEGLQGQYVLFTSCRRSILSILYLHL